MTAPTLTPGDLFKLKGAPSLYRFDGITESDGSVRAYGPLTSDGRRGQHSRARAFRLEDIRPTGARFNEVDQ